MKGLRNATARKSALLALLMGLTIPPIGVRVMGAPPPDETGPDVVTSDREQPEPALSNPPSQVEHEIPPILYSGDRSYPAWVSADAAITPSGEVIDDLFSQASRFELEATFKRKRPINGCLRIKEFYTDYPSPPDRTSLEKAIRDSDAIATASVLAKDYGFHASTPGQLIAAEITESIRGPLRVGAIRYFMIPQGEFRAGSYDICKIDRRYARPPEVGEEVLLLIPSVEEPEDPFLDLVWSTSLITFQEEGTASLPRRFSLADSTTKETGNATAGEVTKSQVLHRVRQYVGRGHGRDRCGI